MHQPYPVMEDAREAWPIIRQAIQGNLTDKASVVKAVYTVEGFAFSLYPGEPGLGLSAAAEEAIPEGYGQNEMIDDLDNALGLSAGPESAKAIPWRVILPILMALLQEWLKK